MKRFLLAILLLPVCLTAFGQVLPDSLSARELDSLLYGTQLDSLEEVVVVGYGMVRKSDLTGAVTSIRVNDEDAARAGSLDKLIQGRAAGVQVVRNGGAPDGGITMRIRGMSSFNGSSEPLYVVDGIILNTSQGGETLLSRGADNGSSDEAFNGLLGLNPSDIQSVEILKDASATAIYGALGANGVVLITTKMGRRERPTIRFTAGVDVSMPSKRIDVLSFDEYVQYLRDTGSSDWLKEIYEDPETGTGLKVRPVDWQKECMRTAVSQRYNFTIYGKPKDLNYAFSLAFNNQQGVIRHTGVKQYIARLNLEWTVIPRLKIGSRFNLAHIHSDMTQATGGGRMSSATSLTRAMISYRPYFADYDAEDLYSYDDGDEDLKSSPYRWMDKNHFSNDRKDYRITPTLYAEATITPRLTFKSTAGLDYRNSERRKFKSSAINTTSSGSAGALGSYEYLNWNWDNLLMFNKRWKGHSLSGTAGITIFSKFIGTQTVEGWNIDQFKGGLDCINYAPNRRESYTEVKSSTLSFLARAIYSYKDRYVLTATFRADGSSKFLGKNKWGFFPSFAAAWRVSQEPWFRSSWISSMKLRAGWGRVGDQSIAEYQTANTYTISAISAHDPGNTSETSVTVTPANFANPHLRWETTEQVNGGLDLSLWNGRLSIAADGYMKTTFDLLQAKEIPASSGMTSYYVNEGTIRNSGFELTVESVPVKTANFEWTLGGNLSFNRNKIVAISETADRKSVWISPTEQKEVVCFEGAQIGNSAYCAQTANIFMQGYEMGLFYGYKIKRIVPEGETGTPISNGGTPRAPGSIDYYDLNGNGYIDEGDRTIIGNPNPKLIYGFNTSLRYKNLTLSVTFSGSYGNDLFNFNSSVETASNVVKHNIVRSAYYDAWRPDNPGARYPALDRMENSDFKKFTSLYIEDGSYLRISDISLSYLIQLKKKALRSITLTASAANPYVFTKYTGWDPDVNTYGTNVKKMGIDGGSYPSCRTFSFDVRFSF